MQFSFSVQQNLIYVYNEDYSQAIPSPPQSDEKIDNEPEGPAAWEPDADLGDEEAEKNEDKEDEGGEKEEAEANEPPEDEEAAMPELVQENVRPMPVLPKAKTQKIRCGTSIHYGFDAFHMSQFKLC